MTSLEIRDLGVSLSNQRILHNLNFDVSAGQFAAILGPSGCGKTTLLRTIAGLITPTAGTIRFGKQLVSVSSLVLPPHKRNIGYVPQEGGLFPHLTVSKNISFALKKNVSKEEKVEIVREMLDLVGLQGFSDRYPQELSGGQQTRVALARALAIKPALVLMDEPFAALDQTLRSELSEEVVSLLKKTKTTTLMVTHDREDALVSADLVALMQSGTVVQAGSPKEVYFSPVSPLVAESTGDVVTIPGSIFGLSNSLASSGDEELLVRPEEIKVSKEPVSEGIQAKVSRINFYGHDALLELEFPGLDRMVRARVSAPLEFSTGDQVYTRLQGPIRWVSRNATRE